MNMETLFGSILILLTIFLFKVEGRDKTTTEIDAFSDYRLTIDDQEPLHVVDKRFLSVAFSAGQLNKTDTGINPDSLRLRNLLQALSPAYIRLGGTKANFIVFQPREDGGILDPTANEEEKKLEDKDNDECSSPTFADKETEKAPNRAEEKTEDDENEEESNSGDPTMPPPAVLQGPPWETNESNNDEKQEKVSEEYRQNKVSSKNRKNKPINKNKKNVKKLRKLKSTDKIKKDPLVEKEDDPDKNQDDIMNENSENQQLGPERNNAENEVSDMENGQESENNTENDENSESAADSNDEYETPNSADNEDQNEVESEDDNDLDDNEPLEPEMNNVNSAENEEQSESQNDEEYDSVNNQEESNVSSEEDNQVKGNEENMTETAEPSEEPKIDSSLLSNVDNTNDSNQSNQNQENSNHENVNDEETNENNSDNNKEEESSKDGNYNTPIQLPTTAQSAVNSSDSFQPTTTMSPKFLSTKSSKEKNNLTKIPPSIKLPPLETTTPIPLKRKNSKIKNDNKLNPNQTKGAQTVDKNANEPKKEGLVKENKNVFEVFPTATTTTSSATTMAASSIASTTTSKQNTTKKATDFPTPEWNDNDDDEYLVTAIPKTIPKTNKESPTSKPTSRSSRKKPKNKEDPFAVSLGSTTERPTSTSLSTTDDPYLSEIGPANNLKSKNNNSKTKSKKKPKKSVKNAEALQTDSEYNEDVDGNDSNDVTLLPNVKNLNQKPKQPKRKNRKNMKDIQSSKVKQKQHSEKVMNSKEKSTSKYPKEGSTSPDKPIDYLKKKPEEKSTKNKKISEQKLKSKKHSEKDFDASNDSSNLEETEISIKLPTPPPTTTTTEKPTTTPKPTIIKTNALGFPMVVTVKPTTSKKKLRIKSKSKKISQEKFQKDENNQNSTLEESSGGPAKLDVPTSSSFSTRTKPDKSPKPTVIKTNAFGFPIEVTIKPTTTNSLSTQSKLEPVPQNPNKVSTTSTTTIRRTNPNGFPVTEKPNISKTKVKKKSKEKSVEEKQNNNFGNKEKVKKHKNKPKHKSFKNKGKNENKRKSKSLRLKTSTSTKKIDKENETNKSSSDNPENTTIPLLPTIQPLESKESSTTESFVSQTSTSTTSKPTTTSTTPLPTITTTTLPNLPLLPTPKTNFYLINQNPYPQENYNYQINNYKRFRIGGSRPLGFYQQPFYQQPLYQQPILYWLKRNKINFPMRRIRRASQEKLDKLRSFRNYNMSADMLDKIVQLAKDSRLRLLFDLNNFIRQDNNQWDSSNTEDLFDYVKLRQYKIDFQLGNEPNHYKKFGTQRDYPPEQIGEDYVVLRKLLNKKELSGNPLIIGPDTTRPKSKGKLLKWLNDFLSVAKDAIDVLGWHQYYVDGRKASAQDFLNPDIMTLFVKQCEEINLIRTQSDFKKPIWLTETSSAWGGGAKNLSNRYADGFLYLDKLGIAAQQNISVVARQTFMSGKYALVDIKANYEPSPSYYLAVLFKKLIGTEVLNVNGGDSKFRVYAHCTKKSKKILPGSVTVFIINLNRKKKTFSFNGYQLLPVKQYLLTADSLDSNEVKLNGKILKLEGDDLPKMKGKVVKQPISIPAESFSFYVLDEVSAQAC